MLTGPRPFPVETMTETIWGPDGELRPLRPPLRLRGSRDVALLVAGDDAAASGPFLGALRECGRSLSMEAWVVSYGAPREGAADTGTLRIPPAPGRGLPFAYNVALRLAQASGPHHYYWLLTPEVALDAGEDLVQRLVLLADANPELALIGPAAAGPGEAAAPSAADTRPPYRRFALTAAPPATAVLVRGEALARAGFLDPHAASLPEALAEYALRLRAHGWKSARCDDLRVATRGNGAPPA